MLVARQRDAVAIIVEPRPARADRGDDVLEKGPELPTDGSTQDIRIVVAEGQFHNHDPWLDGRGREFVPQEYYNLGGKTKWYGAALLRFAPEEFAANPASQYRGWPFGYDELEPYYDQAETLLRVRSFEIEPDTARLVAALKHVAPAWRAEPMPLGLSSRILEDPLEARRFDESAMTRAASGGVNGPARFRADRCIAKTRTSPEDGDRATLVAIEQCEGVLLGVVGGVMQTWRFLPN